MSLFITAKEANLGFNVIPDHRRFDYIAVSWAKLNTPN